MAISVTCTCGHKFTASQSYAGQRRKCMYCGALYIVPGSTPVENSLELQPSFEFEKGEDPSPAAAPSEDLAQRGAKARATYGAPPLRPQGMRIVHRPNWSRRYWLLMLTMVPLVIASLKKDGPDVKDRLIEQISELDDSDKEKLMTTFARMEKGEATEADFFDALPGHKLKGALLPAKTWAHWLMALISGIVFLTVACLLFPADTTSPGALIAVGIFTGTIGILLLLGVQWIALHMSGFPRGGGVIALLFLILRLIGLSYTLALDPDYGFIVSLLGFTFGVGLCEELCKALPVFHHFVTVGKKMDWRGAAIWGLCSGIGFGVSEGITYSSDYYNGKLGGEIYIIRFVSCVALHGIWSAAAALSIWKKRDELNEAGMSYWEMFFRLVLFTFVPMLLHGAYDTLLKKEYQFLAVLVALFSFAYLAWKINDAKKTEKELEPHVVIA